MWVASPPPWQRTRNGCGSGSRNWRRSTAPRPPRASAGPPSGWSPATPSSAPRRGSRPSRRTAPTGGRSGSAPRWAHSGRIAGLRGRRLLGAVLGALGAAGIADDFPPGQRRLRRPLPKRTTYNVVCELGDPDAERTVVVIAHHDSAHSGLVFHPQIPLIADRLGLIENTDTSPTLMAPVVGGPLLAALGALTGKRLLGEARPPPRPRLGRGDGRHRPAQGRPRRQRQRHRGRRRAGPGPALRRGAARRASG